MSTSAEELKNQGVKLFQQQDYEAAARTFQQAQDAYNEAGQHDMSAEMLTNIGLVHRALGEHQQALDMMQQALNIFQELDDAKRTAMVLGNMGGVYSGLGDKEQAYKCYRQAADIFAEIGETKLHGETLVALGSLQMREGKFTAGAATYTAGLDELDSLSASQKIIKGLTGTISKLTGGGSAKSDK